MLALRLGCTVEELGWRLTAEEFAEWRVMFDEERLHPVNDRMAHAQLLAAAHNGKVGRRGNRLWSGLDFMPHPAWMAPASNAPDFKSLKAQVASINSRIRRRDS